jgi:hypothetical protein
MKRIKLFEKFNTSNILALRDDIRSVLYELEDMDLNVRFRTFTKVGTDEDANRIDGTDVDCFLIMVKPKNPSKKEDIKEKMEWFLELLKNHLDYIKPNKIKLGSAASGRFDYITIKI